MAGHGIDVALAEGAVEDHDLVCEPWRTDAMVLIAAPSHPLAAAAGRVVAAGMGLAIVSAATVRDQVALGRLAVIPWQGFSIKRPLWRLKKPGRMETPAARAFGKLLEVSTEGTDLEIDDSSREAVLR